MTIGNRIGNWVDRQISDIKDVASFSYENLRGNNPPSPGRRQFLKATGTAVAGGGLAGYSISEQLDGDGSDQNPQDGGQSDGSADGDGQGGGAGGSSGGSGSDPTGGTESIYDILDDSGDADIQIVEDWLGDAYDRGHTVDNVIMGYSDNRDEDYLAFLEGGEAVLPLWLSESSGYSDSEVDALREYDEEGKLGEVLEPAVE